MNLDQIAATLWRSRVFFVAALLACLTAVVAVTFLLPKTYKSTATLFVGVNKEVNEALAFDTQVGEQLARTYTTLAANPNVAEDARKRLPFDMSRKELLDRMSFAPVERTQLLEITAEAGSQEQAQQLANTYADAFVDRVGSQYAKGETQTKISVNEPAAVPPRAAKPNPPLYIGLGALLSLLTAGGVVLLRDRIDNRLRVAEDDDVVLDEPVMARIPDMASKHGEDRLQMNDAFRLLKTNIDFFDEGRAQVVLVTSPSPVEGKSTVCGQLALAAAADGERVVLIEADLRRPGLGNTMLGERLQHSDTGLTNYLVGAADVDSIVTPQPGLPGLHVIWAGPLPPNPSSLLGSARLRALIEDLRVDFDRIVIDTPPMSVGADSSVMVRVADGALYVIDTRKTKRSTAQAGLNQLDKARAKVLGVVLNRVSVGSGDTYGYYRAPVDGPPAPAPRRPAGV